MRTDFQVILAANAVETVVTSGRYFYCFTATAAFFVRPNVGAEISVDAGRGWSVAGAFSLLQFRNPTAAELTVTCSASDSPISDNRPVLNTTVTVQQTPDATLPASGIVLIAAADTVQQLAPGSTAYFVKAWLYPAKAVANGVLTPNAAGDIYAGLTATHLPDKRAIADTDYPIVLEPAPGRKVSLAAIRIRGKATDGVCYVYLPA